MRLGGCDTWSFANGQLSSRGAWTRWRTRHDCHILVHLHVGYPAATLCGEHKSLGVASAGLVHANSVPGSAHATHAALAGATGVAAEKRGQRGGRPDHRRSDDGARARGQAVYVRQDQRPGWLADRGDDALYSGSNKQEVDRF